ncbi:MAG: hypothetical protein RLZZ86_38 [Cyanobacteriota bacterium]|jgi:hypothetical protein
MAKVTPTVAVQIVANIAQFGGALAKASKDLNAFQKQLSNIQNAVVGVFAAQNIGQFGVELAKLGGEAQAVGAAFKTLEGSTELMRQLKEVTGGTVSELELMKRSVQAANFGINLKQLPELFKFATLRAQQTGQSVDYLVESIIMGIGRKSPMILDNLGISLVRLREKLGDVGSESASVAQFTKIVGDIAKEELGKMPGFAETAATSIARINAAWDNIKVNIGDSAVFKNTMSIISEMIIGIERFTKKLESQKLTDEISDINLLVNAIANSNIHSKTRLELLKELDSKYPNFLKKLDLEKVTNEQLVKRLEDVNGQYARKIQMVAAEESMAEASKKVLDLLRAQAVSQKELDRLESMRGKESVTGYGGLPRLKADETLESDIKRKEKAIDMFNNKIEDAIREEMVLMDNFKKVLEKFTTGTKDVFAATNTGIAQVADQTKIRLAELEKRLGSINNLKIDLKSLFPKTVFEEAREKLAEEGRKANLAFVMSFLDGKVELPKWMQEIIDKIIGAQKTIADQTKQFNEALGQQLTQLRQNEIEQLSASLGELVAGGIEFKDFGRNIINSIANFMELFGKQLIQIGLGKDALDNLFKGLGKGGIAIAAGIALIGAAAYTKSRISQAYEREQEREKIAERTSNRNTRSINSSSSRIEVTGTLVGSGRDLIAVINQTNYDNNIRKGG